jgi:hypothetical protein
VSIPVRRKGGLIEWREPNVGRVAHFLHNPAYKGTYCFGQQRVDQDFGLTDSGRPKLRPGTHADMIVIPNHHPAYISPEDWEENQDVLKLNAPSKSRRNLGPGTALLQGVIRCGKHSGMSPSYHKKKNGRHEYHHYNCVGDNHNGGKCCPSTPGQAFDRAVVDAMFARLEVPAIRAIEEAWEAARTSQLSEERRRQIEIQRATLAVDDAKRRALGVSPANRDVLDEYEALWQQAKDTLHRLQVMITAEPSQVRKFTKEKWSKLLSLFEDLPALWNNSRTPVHERKQLIRTMIEAVVVEERTEEHITARVVWVDGAPDTVIEIKRVAYSRRLIMQWASEGLARSEIAARLRHLGLRTLQGREWSRETVWKVIRNAGA